MRLPAAAPQATRRAAAGVGDTHGEAHAGDLLARDLQALPPHRVLLHVELTLQQIEDPSQDSCIQTSPHAEVLCPHHG